MGDRPAGPVEIEELAGFLESARAAQLRADASILSAAVGRLGNPNANRELARLRRVEAAAKAIWEFKADGWNELGAALDGKTRQ